MNKTNPPKISKDWHLASVMYHLKISPQRIEIVFPSHIHKRSNSLVSFLENEGINHIG